MNWRAVDYDLLVLFVLRGVSAAVVVLFGEDPLRFSHGLHDAGVLVSPLNKNNRSHDVRTATFGYDFWQGDFLLKEYIRYTYLRNIL